MLSLWNDPVFRLLDDVMGSTSGASTAVRSFTPSVDVRVDESGIAYEVDVPGVKQEDLAVECENGKLTVSGERKFFSRDDKGQMLLGRGYGKFSQSFVIPDWADVDKLEAHLDSGVLTVTMPKRESAKPRKIRILGPSNGESKQLGESSDK